MAGRWRRWAQGLREVIKNASFEVRRELSSSDTGPQTTMLWGMGILTQSIDDALPTATSAIYEGILRRHMCTSMSRPKYSHLTSSLSACVLFEVHFWRSLCASIATSPCFTLLNSGELYGVAQMSVWLPASSSLT